MRGPLTRGRLERVVKWRRACTPRAPSSEIKPRAATTRGRGEQGSTTPDPIGSTARAAPWTPRSLACSIRRAARHLTPGITRPHTTSQTFKLSDDIRAAAGWVHAVVRWRRLCTPRAPDLKIKPRATTLREASRAGFYHAGCERFNGASGARRAGRSRIKPSTLGATSNARHHPRP
jgi:hypothetical protein